MSIFNKLKDYVEPVKRNSFDGSFQNNLTMQFGGLYPVMCKEVLPGDSFKIKPTFAIKSWPMLFPVQTRMRAYLHFFYVRNRNLWKDWPDFIGKTKDGLELPYIAPDSESSFHLMLSTGSLGDYLGIPTHSYGSFGSVLGPLVTEPEQASRVALYNPLQFDEVQFSFCAEGVLDKVPPFTSASISELQSVLGSEDVSGFKPGFSSTGLSPASYGYGVSSFSRAEDHEGHYYDFVKQSLFSVGDSQVVKSLSPGDSIRIKLGKVRISSSEMASRLALCIDGSGMQGFCVSPSSFIGSTNELQFILPDALYPGDAKVSLLVGLEMDVTDPDSMGTLITPFGIVKYEDEELPYWVTSRAEGLTLVDSYLPAGTRGGFQLFWTTQAGGNNTYCNTPFGLSFLNSDSATISVAPYSANETEITYSDSPYAVSGSGAKDGQIKVSALPFRAYESIYNSFYRDTTNNPYMLNGVPEYNLYIPTQDGGADTNIYELRYRNWESDFLTSAKQSPQQGVAPLVGISSAGTMTFQDEDGKVYQAQAEFSEDGSTIQSFKVLSPDMPKGNLRALVDMASSGISINDLRNVNALQRWLEANIRRGLRYREQIKTHFDVDVEYQTLDMPEFIGGYAEDIYVNQVTQTSSGSTAEDTPLGWFAGVGNLVKTAKRSISRYFDEHGYVIGILSVAPVPNYSQVLPKHFLKRNTLDYYFPEFGHIGMQPIFYSEVCPIQAYSESPGSLDDTFGYQRAWYDYLANIDEVHGLFRSSLRNFVFNRVFDVKPELSPAFLVVDPEQLNDVFAVTEVTDKLLGQVYFDIKMKRPIPVYGVPALDSHNLP